MAISPANSDPNQTNGDKSWQDCFANEKKRIKTRRQVAFEMEEKVDSDEDIENLTGLSLSGGGIRSALFNDGLLQSLSHKGLLRYVDYLSTVSGGGYIGGHLISCGILKQLESKKKVEKDKKTEAEIVPDNDDIESAQESQLEDLHSQQNFHSDRRFWELGKDPSTGRVDPTRLRGVGSYLEKTSGFFTRYFMTQIFVFMLYLGFVGAMAAIAALFWRAFDHEPFRDVWVLSGLNQWGSEMSLAFYPTIWLVLTWFVISVLRVGLSIIIALDGHWSTILKENTWPQRSLSWLAEPRPNTAKHMGFITNILGICIAVSLLIGIAVVMGNGITQSHSTTPFDQELSLNRFAEFLAIAAGAMQLLVFFGRDRLFKSEQAEAKTWERIFGKVMSYGVAGLLLFAMVHWMASENISSYTIHRDRHLERNDVISWNGLQSLQPTFEQYDRLQRSKKLSENFNLMAESQKQHNEVRNKLVAESTWRAFRPDATPANPSSPLFESDQSKENLLTSASDGTIAGACRSFVSTIKNFLWISYSYLVNLPPLVCYAFLIGILSIGISFFSTLLCLRIRKEDDGEKNEEEDTTAEQNIISNNWITFLKQYLPRLGNADGKSTVVNNWATAFRLKLFSNVLAIAGLILFITGLLTWNVPDVHQVTINGQSMSLYGKVSNLVEERSRKADSEKNSNNDNLSAEQAKDAGNESQAELVAKYKESLLHQRIMRTQFIEQFNTAISDPSFTFLLLDALAAKKSDSKPKSQTFAELDIQLGEISLLNSVIKSPKTFKPSDKPRSNREIAAVLKPFFDGNSKSLQKLTSQIQSFQNHPNVETDKLGDDDLVNNGRGAVEVNRTLLGTGFPNIFKPLRVASTHVVVRHDQATRQGWLGFFLAMLLLGIFGTVNQNWQNSIFHFYRYRLRKNFLSGWFDDPKHEATVKDRKGEFSLSNCDVTNVGLPYPLLLGTWMQRQGSRIDYQPFLFSPKKIGITDRNSMIEEDQSKWLQDTVSCSLPGMNGDIELADAVAISGSAVTPLMTQNFWLASLIDFFGVGLGQWMRLPSCDTSPTNWLPGYVGRAYRFLRSLTTNSNRSKDFNEFGFVADGGYEDVLGAYELLRRKCELIIVSDACCNTNSDELGALAKMLEAANTNLGIRFFDLDHESTIDFERLKRNTKSNLPQNHILMRVRYPDNQGETRRPDGLLIYLQMGITDKDPIEIQQIRNKFPAFPDEPTSNQFYTAEQVAAYRKLGYYIGEKICSQLERWEPKDIRTAQNYHYHCSILLGNDESKTSTNEKANTMGREFFGSGVAETDSDDSEADDYDPHRPYGDSNAEEAIRIKGISTKRQPLFDVILRRLLTGYRLACFEEEDYSMNDIISEAIWDRKEWCFVTFEKSVTTLKPMVEIIPQFNCGEERLAAIQALCFEWLRVLQANADVCAIYRSLVFHDVNRGMLTTSLSPSRSQSILSEMLNELGYERVSDDKQTVRSKPDQENHNLKLAAVYTAHFAAIAMACQQFHRGTPKTIFQVGGREKLVDLTTSLFLKSGSTAGNLTVEIPDKREDAGHWRQWLYGNCSEIVELKTGVFDNANIESTVSFTQVLILHLNAIQGGSISKLPNPVLMRKRIHDAVSNFGIGEGASAKTLKQIVSELLEVGN